MSETVDKIKKQASEAAAKKIDEQQKRTTDIVNQDIAVIEKILAIVKDRLIYKEVKLASGRTSYVVVTEEILLHDYVNTPQYGLGASIRQVEGSFYSYAYTLITVNGHHYLHAKDLIGKYKYEAARAMEKADKERDLARDRKEAIENLEALEPTVKELMLNYQKHLGDQEAREAEEE